MAKLAPELCLVHALRQHFGPILCARVNHSVLVRSPPDSGSREKALMEEAHGDDDRSTICGCFVLPCHTAADNQDPQLRYYTLICYLVMAVVRSYVHSAIIISSSPSGFIRYELER